MHSHHIEAEDSRVAGAYDQAFARSASGLLGGLGILGESLFLFHPLWRRIRSTVKNSVVSIMSNMEQNMSRIIKIFTE